ncbi:MAG: NAD(P)-dependent dehydrogenase (short-subunit alcohol dehydrogenase family) [Bermanella sp.]|jgi:NAD(P)-dependent dehydrogenase (short-subunit alcohol dehydrogenase family)
MKKIVITGAASGLGEALAKHYAKQGWAVCVADIQEEAGQALAQQLASAHGSDCFFHPLDVTSEAQWQDLYNTVAARWKGVDALINNAGVASSGDIDDLPLKDFQWTIDVNLMGVVKGCYYFTPMLKKHGGYLINVASMAGLIHVPGMSAYNVSKAAVVALSETLCAELESYNIKVSVLCPAFFQTNLTKNMRATHAGGIKVANRLMENSNITADDIAAKVFEESLAGKFHILTHARENMFWRLKRFLPRFYMKQMKKTGEKMHKKMTEKTA